MGQCLSTKNKFIIYDGGKMFRNQKEQETEKKELQEKIHQATETLERKVKSGQVEAEVAKKQITKLERDMMLFKVCSEKEDSDCSKVPSDINDRLQKIKFLESKRNNTNAALTSRLIAGAEYIEASKKAGERPELTTANEEMDKIRNDAAAGKISTQKMYSRVKEIEEKKHKHMSCLLFSYMAKNQGDERERKMECFDGKDSTYHLLIKAIEESRQSGFKK